MDKLYKRTFLNKTEGLAAMVIEAEQDGQNWIEASVTISDCNRNVKIDLGFNKDNRKRRRERLYKIDTMIQMLQEIRNKISE